MMGWVWTLLRSRWGIWLLAGAVLVAGYFYVKHLFHELAACHQATKVCRERVMELQGELERKIEGLKALEREYTRCTEDIAFYAKQAREAWEKETAGCRRALSKCVQALGRPPVCAGQGESPSHVVEVVDELNRLFRGKQ